MRGGYGNKIPDLNMGFCKKIKNFLYKFKIKLIWLIYNNPTMDTQKIKLSFLDISIITVIVHVF